MGERAAFVNLAIQNGVCCNLHYGPPLQPHGSGDAYGPSQLATLRGWKYGDIPWLDEWAHVVPKEMSVNLVLQGPDDPEHEFSEFYGLEHEFSECLGLAGELDAARPAWRAHILSSRMRLRSIDFGMESHFSFNFVQDCYPIGRTHFGDHKSPDQKDIVRAYLECKNPQLATFTLGANYWECKTFVTVGKRH